MTHPLEPTLSYTFRNSALLDEALTHPSMTRQSGQNYQRLEFLGDAVLGLVIAEYLYQEFPEENEGDLARRKAALVSGTTVVRVAQDMGLGEHLRLSESESSGGGREIDSNLEDVCEALIGAIYLDGGLEAARTVILKYWAGLAQELSRPPQDAKTALQEWSQARGIGLPEYTVLSSEGPAHAPIFEVEVRLGSGQSASASGPSKKTAEHAAAARLMALLDG